MPFYLDNIDYQILLQLQKNAQLTNKELGLRLKRSSSSIFDRIKRMQQLRIIKGYTIVIDHEQIGTCLISHIHIKLKEHTYPSLKSFEEAIHSFPEVLECANITGQYDYMLKVCVADMRSYHNFLRHKLGQLTNLSAIHTDTVLSESKHDIGYPVANLKLIP
ncbi:transcriptional regulator, AsnC/Lrp family protein [Pedobacter sp. BAL39]|uniref:Lrp/AsnC family transcriptional regulator n=1 Tax=Pedobacter sp. BAL39 TaxID=391596 RepID=UPI0001559401|nr:Lrp/AsnC family transcriptional regulator [Pedobacter sp. BAL39]EDM36879.1 transcriptional regulator, AsnC/Lrp family protein [Pedobacter sp. BAL39]